MKTFVYIDHFKGEVQPASWEALGLAKSFGTAIALVFGSGADAIAKAAFEYGADEVIVADDPALTDYRAEPYASTLSALASSATPDLILFPTTARTRELAAMSAVDLNSGVLTDVTAIGSERRSSWLRPVRSMKARCWRRRSARPSRSSWRPSARAPSPNPHVRQARTGTLTKGRSQSRCADNRGRLLRLRKRSQPRRRGYHRLWRTRRLEQPITPPARPGRKASRTLARTTRLRAHRRTGQRCSAAQSAHPARQWTAATSPTPIRSGRRAKSSRLICTSPAASLARSSTWSA